MPLLYFKSIASNVYINSVCMEYFFKDLFSVFLLVMCAGWVDQYVHTCTVVPRDQKRTSYLPELQVVVKQPVSEVGTVVPWKCSHLLRHLPTPAWDIFLQPFTFDTQVSLGGWSIFF